MTWQPIESAPKDGTTVLVWSGRVDIADWCEYRLAWLNADGWGLNPTHWMPLPDGPEAA